MRAHWCFSPNFGDRLTHWLVKKITGKAPAFVHQDDPRPHLLGVGSILNRARGSSVIWGAGFASQSDACISGLNIRLVRGPVSAQRARECGCDVPDAYGDPALLCPRFREPSKKQYRLGIVYHYADQPEWPEIPGAKHINVLDEVDAVLDGITECAAIISSSLHGLVVADAYGIPAAWLHSPRVSGDGTKFADCGYTEPLRWEQIEGKAVAELVKLIPARDVRINAEGILKAFPKYL